MIRTTVEVNVSLMLRDMHADDLARLALEALDQCENKLCPLAVVRDSVALAKAEKVRAASFELRKVLAKVFDESEAKQ